MRRLVSAAALLGLLVTACGGDAAPTTTTAPATTTPPATTTTAAETTTTEDSVAYRLTLATILAGNWVGEWSNTTYGSRGDLVVDVRVDQEARTATITLDLSGAVFGGDDPGPDAFTVDLTAAPPYTVATGLLGTVTFNMTTDGSFSLDSADVPAAGIATFHASGTARSERAQADYRVGFEDGGEAVGTVTLRRPAS